ncbi:flagellin [Devosia sp. SD17-2]|uniref:flagellin N-terminal helical domain-containing protein n=1 Tax=Devosia sp. SD17-2 TaxID=2976459 RepID=UPI0023D838FC|nr:flagellin [Devosia sp. SD17-2]WEJ32447.1 flagellin [Devosia sp. SD17-2]
MGSDISLSKAVRANLLSLQNTAQMMDKTQSRLATGNKVNSALDNPSSFFTASALNSRAADMGNLLDSMASGIKVIEAASNGISAITKNVESMQSTLRQARQDKSFKTDNFEVTADSVIKVKGGQFGDESEIKLGVKTPGVAAAVGSAAAYNGLTLDTNGKAGVGARTIVDFGGTNTAANDVITVAGKDVTLTGTDVATAVTNINAALDGDLALKGKYKASVGTGTENAGKLVIESLDPKADAASVTFGTGITAATQSKQTIQFNPNLGGITANSKPIPTGATFEEFVAAFESQAKDGGYSVTSDADAKTVTLTNVAYGTTPVAITNVPPAVTGVQSVSTLAITTAAQTANATVTIGGKTLQLSAAAQGSTANTATEIRTLMEADDDLRGKFSVTQSGSTLTITSQALDGSNLATVTYGGVGNGIVATQANPTSGVAPVLGALTAEPGTAGLSKESVAADVDEVTITYGNDKADIKISGLVKAGSLATAEETAKFRSDTVKNINDQLKAAGLKGVEASFDASGKLELKATSAEAKTLAVSGAASNAIFGGESVSTGTASIDGYNSTNTVDKFVEEINRSHAGKLRASNDNGKLRIENLSTQELDVSFDKDGAGAGSPTSSKIDGNVVRANLSKQFNELRDQLDKLSDDSSFNGINLLRGDKLKITFNESGSSAIDIQAKDQDGNVRGINASNLSIASLTEEDLDTDAKIDAFLATLSNALTELRSQASTFGSNLSSVENRQSFTKNMINTLETGAANLTLADTNAEAANLLALQTRQQLSSSALSMASQQDQAVLQLLR